MNPCLSRMLCPTLLRNSCRFFVPSKKSTFGSLFGCLPYIVLLDQGLHCGIFLLEPGDSFLNKWMVIGDAAPGLPTCCSILRKCCCTIIQVFPVKVASWVFILQVVTVEALANSEFWIWPCCTCWPFCGCWQNVSDTQMSGRSRSGVLQLLEERSPSGSSYHWTCSQGVEMRGHPSFRRRGEVVIHLVVVSQS